LHQSTEDSFVLVLIVEEVLDLLEVEDVVLLLGGDGLALVGLFFDSLAVDV
jgi:hypothetical protein